MNTLIYSSNNPSCVKVIDLKQAYSLFRFVLSRESSVIIREKNNFNKFK